MSKDLVLENFIHNSLCDIPGCKELAKQTLGAEGASGGLKLNICPECLQTIVNIVPLETIMNRPDIKEMLQEDEVKEGLEAVGKALEGEESEYNLLGFNDLKSLAVARGLSFKVGMSKTDLIQFLTEQ